MTFQSVAIDALAVIGSTPVKIRVGNLIKLPPPATALSPPAMKAVPHRSKVWRSVKGWGSIIFSPGGCLSSLNGNPMEDYCDLLTGCSAPLPSYLSMQLDILSLEESSRRQWCTVDFVVSDRTSFEVTWVVRCQGAGVSPMTIIIVALLCRRSPTNFK